MESKYVNTTFNRWSDAAVHSIAAALMLKRSEVFYFYDIGYNQSNVSHCPSEPAWVPIEKCSCEPKDSFERRICAKRFLEVTGKLKREFLPHHKE
jgi:alpha 1,2-mannosyltransferase